MWIQPRKFIVIGLILVVLGVVGPVLMVLRIVAATFWLSLLSYGASFVGLFLGLLGSAFYAREQVRKRDDFDSELLNAFRQQR